MKLVVRAMAMDEATWERHANRWSVWTRVPILPLIALAIWSRVWIGWWCLLPIALLIGWTFVNPRAFPPPASTRSWASRAVLGERIWLARAEVPIPAHHALWLGLLAGVPAIGIPPLIWGLWALEPWATLLGLIVIICPKMWFLDRCVWLFDDMARRHPAYAAWLR